tara:strand:+ start:149 stop:319 length:171 start_codon:yes stop_codon:yes gene_type:complete
MKAGNLIRYNEGGEKYKLLAVVTKVNAPGGTVKAVDTNGNMHWLVASSCEVLNESR